MLFPMRCQEPSKMSTTKVLYGGFLLLAVLSTQAWACNRRDTNKEPSDSKGNETDADGGSSPSQDSTTVNACCLCGQPIDVYIVVSNQFQEPHFEFETEVKDLPQRELLYKLEDAATQDRRFRFSAQYFGSLGYMITTLNELSASVENKTYWKISSYKYENGLPLGVSSYIPGNHETVMFNFTSYATPDNH